MRCVRERAGEVITDSHHADTVQAELPTVTAMRDTDNEFNSDNHCANVVQTELLDVSVFESQPDEVRYYADTVSAQVGCELLMVGADAAARRPFSTSSYWVMQVPQVPNTKRSAVARYTRADTVHRLQSSERLWPSHP